MVEIALGQKVQDRLTGFAGIVTTVGYHYNGCVRIGVRPDTFKEGKSRETLPEEEYLFPAQVQVVEEETEWTDLDTQTDHEYDLGDLITDRVTKFTGVVQVVNTKLFNEPRYYVKDQADDDEPNTEWIDQSSADLVQADYIDPDVDFEEPIDESTTGSLEDSGSRELKRK
jgi:heat shock protein HspQ